MEKLQGKNRSQTVQFLFTMVLFFAMAICALFTILLGAKVYENITDRMDQNFTGTTALSYVSNKVRQGDEAGAVTVADMEGTPVLKIDQRYGEEVYNTLIYFRDGQIKELFSKEDSGLTLDDGMNIMESQGIQFEMLRGDLLKVETKGENSGSIILNLRSGEAGQ